MSAIAVLLIFHPRIHAINFVAIDEFNLYLLKPMNVSQDLLLICLLSVNPFNFK
jgi:hypothetical protein